MLNTEEYDEEYELERQLRHKQFKDAVKQTIEENAELLERLSND